MSETPDAVAVPPSPWRQVFNPRVTLLLVVALLSATTFYMVEPFFLIYFRHAQGLSTSESGLLVSVPFLAVMLLGLAGGYVADRIGVVRAYTLGLLVYGLSVGAVALVHRFVDLLLLMIIAGLAMSVTSGGIQSILNLTASPTHRGILQNYLYWINNVGALLGLLMASELLRAGQSNVPIMLLSAVRVAMFIVLVILFWRDRSAASVDASKPVLASERPRLLPVVKGVLADKPLRYTVVSMFLLTIMESQLDSTVPLYFTEHFRDGVAVFGPIVALGTVVVVACQPLALKVSARKNSTATFSVGALLTGIGLTLGGTIGSVWAWVMGMFFYSMGEVLWAIELNNRVSALPREESTASYFGAVGMAQNAAFFIGIALGSLAFHVFGASAVFGSMPIIGIIVGFFFARGAAGNGDSRREANV
ncbi:MFS transporter [Sulfobacillus harzensis]|uniref:MFS transporter n=1 Tax=Sulfobacillus harzensis TaxID=2729629 RepID=A0A7Y0L7P7_9FIRM|nr:MFS transporter [Sulfobacillus harzensis]NMP24854.1 MFS transporter [Sulfobacillus harzensis]